MINHPLHDQSYSDFVFTHSHSTPSLSIPSLIKPFSAPNLKSTPSHHPPTPPPPSPPPITTKLIHPNSHSPHSHSPFKKLARVIKRSSSFFNRFIRLNRNSSATGLSSSSLPPSLNSDPPHPLPSSTPNSSSGAPCSSSQSHTHPPGLHRLSISPLSPTDAASPKLCHSATSSGEFSFRRISNLDHGSPSSAHSKSHANWIKKLSQPQTTRRLPWSDQNSIHPTLNSNAGRSSSPAQCSSPGSTGTRRYCNSPSPNQLQPVFGITIKEALRLASQEYQSSSKKVEIPTIVYKCGERLKCPEGMKSHGVFRINGNIKRMRKLESVFMNPDLGYGTDFDISSPRPPPTDPQAIEDRTHLALEQTSQLEPYFTLHDVAGVLRRYLWALPEPLVPYKVTIELVQVWRKFHARQEEDSRDVLIEELERVLQENMKREEIDLLTYLLEILGLFSTRSEDNLMNSKNLAIVFQPGIMPLEISEEDQSSHQQQVQNHHHQNSNLHQLSKSRSSEQMCHSSQQQVPIDFQSRSTLQVAHGIGLDDYLGQINEVQEILSMLIEHSASHNNNLNVNDFQINWKPHCEFHKYLFSESQPFNHFKGSGDDGG